MSPNLELQLGDPRLGPVGTVAPILHGSYGSLQSPAWDPASLSALTLPACAALSFPRCHHSTHRLRPPCLRDSRHIPRPRS